MVEMEKFGEMEKYCDVKNNERPSINVESSENNDDRRRKLELTATHPSTQLIRFFRLVQKTQTNLIERNERHAPLQFAVRQQLLARIDRVDHHIVEATAGGHFECHGGLGVSAARARDVADEARENNGGSTKKGLVEHTHSLHISLSKHGE